MDISISETNYALYLYSHDESPETYLFEEGTYVLTDNEVILTPMSKITCQIKGIGYFDCMKGARPEEGEMLSRDSLTEKQILDLEFTNRSCSISSDDDNVLFKDPSRPYAVFRLEIRN